MQREFTEEELKELAAQLRQPKGDLGHQVAEQMNIGNRAMNLHTLATVDVQPGEHVLEVGMGNGYFAGHILRQFPDVRYTGCDYSADMVKAAEELNRGYVATHRAKFCQADIEQMPFEDASFDKIFTVNTIYFWADHARVLAELKRVLKPNGALILAIRPKHNMDTFSVTRFGFSKMENDQIMSLIKEAGFQFVALTEIKEPGQQRWGSFSERECCLFYCQEQEPNPEAK